jgi:hypothetical protein
MSTNKSIFSSFADNILPELKKVSGRFENSIEYRAEEDLLIIWGSPYIEVLWKGRGKTKNGHKAGTPTLREIIRKWIDEKGIIPYAMKDGTTPSRSTLAFFITRSIHEKGTLLYQNGGKENPFNKILTNNSINNLLSLISDKYYMQIINITK